MTLRPYADNVLVLPDWLRDKRADTFSAGGILLPASKAPAPTEAVLATVIAAGPGFYDEPIMHDEGMPGAKRPRGSSRFVPVEVKAGDRVLVQQAIHGEPHFIDGLEHRIVRAESIVGVVGDERAA